MVWISVHQQLNALLVTLVSTFIEGDVSIHTEWIEYHIKKCDVILPLVAIATPIEYTRNPLRVFELDFEENLKLFVIVLNTINVLFSHPHQKYTVCVMIKSSMKIIHA